jgi:hypothetical protein
MVLRLRGNILEANYVNYLPHGSLKDLPVAFDLDNTAGLYYEPSTNSIVFVQQNNTICSFESNGFIAEKCVFDNAFMDKANANTMSTEDIYIEFCIVNTFVSNTMETNSSYIDEIDIEMSIANVISNDAYTVNASLMKLTDVNTIFVETANIDTSNTNTMFCDESTIENGTFESCYNENATCTTANVDKSFIDTLIVENQDQNTSFVVDHYIDKSTINRGECTVCFIDNCAANVSNLVDLTCGSSTTQRADFGTLVMGMCEVSQNVHVTGNIFTFGNLDYFESNTIVTKPFEIDNLGTGPALKITQYTPTNEGIVSISGQNPAMKIFDGGLVHFSSDSGQDLVGPVKNEFLVCVYGSCSIYQLVTPNLRSSGTTQIQVISATTLNMTSTLQVTGQSSFGSSVTSTTATISGQTTISSSISASDLYFQGSRSLNADFLGVDAAINDLFNSTTSYLGQQYSQLSSQLSGHDSALLADINNMRSTVQNKASSTTSGLNSYIPPKPAAPAM